MDKDHPYYAPSYCEENIYHLCKQSCDEQSFVVIISNEAMTVPFWHNKMRSGLGVPEGLVVWDYHVIYLHNGLVHDFDSDVALPCPMEEYLHHVLKPERTIVTPPQYHRLYRVIKGSAYLEEFASDRSHMLIEGEYLATPPNTACIVPASGEKMNLTRIFHIKPGDVADMDQIDHGLMGTVLSEIGFVSLMRRLERVAGEN